jgi:Protein of unknown function (DUF1018)
MNDTQTSINNAQTERKRQIALIHMAIPSVGWSKEQYKAHLMGEYGVDSCTGLSNAQREQLLNHFKSLGFKIKPASLPGSTRKVITTKPMVTKLRAMWYALAEAGAVQRPGTGLACDKLVEKWAKQELPALDALAFASNAQLIELVERMKAWGRRVGADIH